MSAKGKELKLSYIKQVREQYHGEPLSDLLNVEVHLYFGDDRVRDIDNYQKISMDALTDVVWVDDVQIMRLTIEKHKDKTNPRIELTITKYNGRKQT
jgi:Holliday junction resolvase RusA-like endonuclease